MLTPNNTPFVHVEWEDIVLDDDWQGEGSPVHIKECSTWGYLLVKHPAYIVVASSYDWNDEVWGTKHAISRATPNITVKVLSDEPIGEAE